MAIVLTAMGVDGILEAISAAFAFESVTTSAWTHGAAPSITTAARDPIHTRVRRLDIAVSSNADDGVPPGLFTGLCDAELCALMVVSKFDPWAQHAFLCQGPSVRFRTYCAVDVKRLMAASEEIDRLVWVDSAIERPLSAT